MGLGGEGRGDSPASQKYQLCTAAVFVMNGGANATAVMCRRAAQYRQYRYGVNKSHAVLHHAVLCNEAPRTDIAAAVWHQQLG